MRAAIASVTIETAAVASAFDALAPAYDAAWTDGVVGRLQREPVWRELRRAFRAGDHVLELGCGTGADAVYLARTGVKVHALDVSVGMLRAARQKVEKEGLSGKVTLERRAVETLAGLEGSGQFDGAFSNFGVFNCVRDLGSLGSELAALLRPGGKLIACFIGRFCAWETAWHLLHGRVNKALRRLHARGIEASPIPGHRFTIYYPSIRKVQKALQPEFILRSHRSVGLLVPPSAMEPWAKSRRRLLGRMAVLDRSLCGWPVLRGMGDHRLAVFVRKG